MKKSFLPSISSLVRSVLCLSLECVSMMSFTHVHQVFKGQLATKRSRLAFRLLAVMVLICLPMTEAWAPEKLIPTTAALVFPVVFGIHDCSFVGESCHGEGENVNSGQCPERRRYTLKEGLKDGTVAKVEHLAGVEERYAHAPCRAGPRHKLSLLLMMVDSRPNSGNRDWRHGHAKAYIYVIDLRYRLAGLPPVCTQPIPTKA